MEFNQLRYFCALCEELNFTRAAKRCSVSQPSLTTGICLLERQLGGLLFQRKPRVRLLPLGEAVRPYFKHILETIDAATEIAEQHRLLANKKADAKQTQGQPKGASTTWAS